MPTKKNTLDALIYTGFLLLFVFLAVRAAKADEVGKVSTYGGVTGAVTVDPRVTCGIGEPTCSVLVLNEQEKKILLDEKGILATAAQARSLDLGAFVTYFQQKIAKAPAGDAQKAPEPAKADKEPKKP